MELVTKTWNIHLSRDGKLVFFNYITQYNRGMLNITQYTFIYILGPTIAKISLQKHS